MRIEKLIIAMALLFMVTGCDRTESDWSKAKAANTSGAYSDFLAKHPQGLHVDEANAAIDDLEWADAKAANTIAAFADFQAKHPGSGHAQEANAAIDDLEWASATAGDSIDSYGTYLQKRPQRRHASEAAAGVEELDWLASRGSGAVKECTRYLSKYPHGRHVQDAIDSIDDAKWSLARGAGTVAACESYLTEHENGRNVAAALDFKAALIERESPPPRISTGSTMIAFGSAGSEPPNFRIHFGKEMASDAALTVTIAGVTTHCPLKFQYVGYRLDSGGHRGKRVPVMMYGGCPIVLDDDLAMQRDVELDFETEIHVTAVKGRTLIVDPESVVPFGNNGTLANITWVLDKKGMSFSTRTKHYLAEKPGAKISFRRDGIVTDGVKILPRSAPPSQPASPTTAPAIKQPIPMREHQ